MRERLVELHKPIWNGGRPHIWVADFRLNGADRMKVTIAYTRKDGTKSFPDVYRMDVPRLRTYPTQVVGHTTLYVAPISDWEASAE